MCGPGDQRIEEVVRNNLRTTHANACSQHFRLSLVLCILICATKSREMPQQMWQFTQRGRQFRKGIYNADQIARQRLTVSAGMAPHFARSIGSSMPASTTKTPHGLRIRRAL